MLFHMHSIITNTACSFPSVVPFISSNFKHRYGFYDLWIFNCTESVGWGKAKREKRQYNFTWGFSHLRNVKWFCNSAKLHYCESFVQYFHFFYCLWITCKHCNFHKFVSWLKLLNKCYIRIYSSQKADHELIWTLLQIINTCNFE